jgi:isoleucyl-tRNA synthetase
MEDIIQEELNVKKVIFGGNEEDLVEYQAKANFRALGKELGKDMKAAAEKIETLSRAEIQAILEGSTLAIEVAGRTVDLTPEKLDIKRIEKTGLKVLNEGSLTVALDTEITEDLALEGDVRDLIRGVQNLRKENGLEVSDRIALTLHGSARLKKAFDNWQAYIAAETLALAITWEAKPGQTEIEAGSENWLAKVERSPHDAEKVFHA